VEMRYGVLVDLAQKVYRGEEIDLTMGHVNVIWQGDASALALASLADAANPPWVVNVAGPEILSVREVCRQFGRLLDKSVRLAGCEPGDALLNNGEMAHRRYGPPQICAEQMMRWIAHWITAAGPTLNKPTHFEERDGKF